MPSSHAASTMARASASLTASYRPPRWAQPSPRLLSAMPLRGRMRGSWTCMSGRFQGEASGAGRFELFIREDELLVPQRLRAALRAVGHLRHQLHDLGADLLQRGVAAQDAA